MLQSIKTKLKQLVKYAKENSDWIVRIVVFGETLTSTDELDEVELAVEFSDDFDVNECFDNIVSVVDDIFDGMFELLIINGGYLTSTTLSEIEKGETIYG